MLTQKQRDLLYFIHDKMRKDDVPPSFEEMKEALGLKSKSGIHRLISALVERGFIERLPHRARALEIKRLPEGIGQKPAAASKKSSGRSPAAAVPFFDEVPLFGKIAAGTPIEAIRDEGHSFSLPSGFLGRGDHYAPLVFSRHTASLAAPRLRRGSAWDARLSAGLPIPVQP